MPKSGLKIETILYPGTVNTLESRSIFLRSKFFFFRNVWQFISNSNSSNAKYFYDWPISNSSNTVISNYFLTVRTKEEFTVVHTWTVGSCIVYTGITLLLLIHPFFFIFLSLQFSKIKNFVTLFWGAMRPRRLKLGTHVDNGWMYIVYQHQASAAYSSLYFFIFLSNFQTLKFFITLSLELWGLEGWNLVHRWTVGRCIVYTGSRLLLLIHPFIASFSFLFDFQAIKNFVRVSRDLWGLEVATSYKHEQWVDVSRIWNQFAAAYSSL